MVSLLAYSLNLRRMIFNFVLAVVSFLINGIAAILPSITVFPASINTGIASIMAFLNGWSWLFPIDTLLNIIGVFVIVVLLEFTYFVALFVLGLIHTSIRG